MTRRRIDVNIEVAREQHQTRAEFVPEWSRRLPISVNDTYGDPFIPEQVSNTLMKLQALSDHLAPIAIFTKAGPDERVLDALRVLDPSIPVVVFYSLTALDEGGISFTDRTRMIEELTTIFANVMVFTRPIIAGRNDDPATLRRLVEVAEHATGHLVLGGLHDRFKNKYIDFSVEDTLIDLCDAAGVKSFHKTSCAGAYAHGMPCWMHELGDPRNSDVAQTFYPQLSWDERGTVLPEGTTGDINFLRLLTGSRVHVESLFSNYNLLTCATGSVKLESTSSWFAWSENIEVCLDCDYCIIKQIEYLKKEKVQIGVHPSRLLEVLVPAAKGPEFGGFRMTKLRRDQSADDRHVYNDVRVEKPCFVGRYEPRVQATPT
ncbi:MAG: hypothetical protein JWM47_829 [Acidimicrobiales bacterium]|nr:hypothetical protein [Acidimicrobiales bacterium]